MTQSTKTGLWAYMMVSLQGAFRLLVGNINGLHYFSPTSQSAVLSFSSFLISMPIWLFIQAYWGPVGSTQADFLPQLLLSFSIHLTGIFMTYMIVSRLCREIKRSANFPLYVTLQNWGLAVISIILLALSLAVDALDLSEKGLMLLQSFIVAMQVAYTFYLTKISLNISFWMAVGIVTLEIVINFVLLIAHATIVLGSQIPANGTGFPAS